MTTPILYVQICEAKPNKLFSEETRQSIRFLRFNRRVTCAACGKKVLIPWTMICQFKASDMTGFTMRDYPQSFAPLTPVCGDHPIHPDWPANRKPKQKTQ